MDVYLSYKNINFANNFIDTNWEPIDHYKKQIQLKLLKLNFYLLKLNYKNIYLLTDKDTIKEFENLPWTNIYTIFEDLKEEDTNAVPILHKLYAYNFAASKLRPFFHIDNDFLITKKIDENFINSDAIAQWKEPCDVFLREGEVLVKNLCKKYYYLDKFPKYHYNCGIVGGTNYSFLKEYSSSSINFILDPANKNFVQNEKFITRWEKCIISEQAYYASCAEKLGIEVKFLLEERNTKKLFEKTGCIHLMGTSKYSIFKDILFNFSDPLEFISKTLGIDLMSR